MDERIGRIKEQAGPLDAHRAAILAALSLTDELLQARGELEEYRNELAETAENLARRLEDALESGGPAS